MKAPIASFARPANGSRTSRTRAKGLSCTQSSRVTSQPLVASIPSSTFSLQRVVFSVHQSATFFHFWNSCTSSGRTSRNSSGTLLVRSISFVTMSVKIVALLLPKLIPNEGDGSGSSCSPSFWGDEGSSGGQEGDEASNGGQGEGGGGTQALRTIDRCPAGSSKNAAVTNMIAPSIIATARAGARAVDFW